MSKTKDELISESDETPINVKTKKPYKGENESNLKLIQTKKGFESNEWGTFICWKQLGRSINKGEKGVDCFYPTVKKTDKMDEDGNPKIIKVRKYFKVFNFNQTSESKKVVSEPNIVDCDNEELVGYLNSLGIELSSNDEE